MFKKEKKEMCNQSVLSLMACGSKTWATTKLLERKLASAQRGMERLMLRIGRRSDEGDMGHGTDHVEWKIYLGSLERKKWQ